MQFVSIADLSARWPVYTPRGVRKLTGSRDFPAPVFTVGQGRVKVWSLVEIEAFESTHPEVRSQTAKRNKIIGFRRAVAKGYPTQMQEGEDNHGA